MRPNNLPILMAVLLIAVLSLFAQNRSDPIHPCQLYDDQGQPIIGNTGPYLPCHLKPWSHSFETDQIVMHQIGTGPGPLYYSMIGADADQDNLFEIYMYIKDNVGGWTFTYRIYENDGTNNYPLVFRSTEGMIPYAYGDTDGDSLPDVIGQNGYYVESYESPTQGELPTLRVWQSPQLMNVTGYTAVGDLDQDGQGEIIHTQNSFGIDNRLVIFECTGNNQYQQIFNQQVSNNNLGTKAVADFDGDGLMEVAFSSGGGDVYVFESPGNNQFQLTFTENMNAFNAYACSYADDIDGNGRPEFVCSGSSSSLGWVTRIYEAAGNDSFIVRQEICIIDGYTGLPGNAVGDLDGDGTQEIIIQTAQALHLYQWNGVEFVNEGTIPENFGYILHGIFSYDSNFNGYDDLFWLGLGDSGYWTNLTIILENEDTGGPPDVTVTLTPASQPIVIYQSGGSFDFTFRVDYNETTTSEFDGWLMIQFPDSSWHGPVIDQLTLPPLSSGSFVELDTTYIVSAGLDTGTYLFEARIGNYPDQIWDSDSFPFQIIIDSTSIKNNQNTTIPKEFALFDNYPNPFNPTTKLSFDLPIASHVILTVYDILGRQVATLINGWQPSGTHQVTFNGSHLSSGIYFYELTANNYHAVRKAILLK
jgi:hypothetical protein